jgi:hypothetical protein
LINAVALGLVIPVLSLGSIVRNEIFLHYLPRYQAMTDLLIKRAAASLPDSVVHLPSGGRSLLLNDSVLIERKDKNFVVLYTTRDSSAVGHSGYMYLSADDPEAVKAKRPELWYKRLAPNWYLWGD